MVAFLVPLGIQAAVRAAPFAARFAKPALKFGYEGLKKGLGYFRPYQMAPGVRASGNQIIQSGKFAGQKFKDVYPNLFRRGNMPRFNITSTNPANIALQTGATAAPFAYDFLTESAEESVNNQENKKPDPGGPVDTVPDKKIFDSRKRTKSAAYNAMVQFGLNLASSKDPNLLKAIAESAKDPMKEFADLGNQLMDRAESIKKAGIESGVAAYDKAQDREVDREAIAADILKEQIKQDAKTLSRGEFITATMESIAGNQTLVDAITSVKYDKDGKLIENAPSDAALIQKYAEEQYDIYRAVEIPPGSAGDELYESLPSGSRYYDQQTGTYGTKP